MSLEENLRQRALTSRGVRNAGRVDIKAHFKTRGNADSSPPPPPPPPPQIDIISTQTRGKSKAKPNTIRQGNAPVSDSELELLPPRQPSRKTPTNSQLESIESVFNKSDSEGVYLRLYGSNWCTQERCPNYQKKACLERTVGGESVHYELSKRLFDLWGERLSKGGLLSHPFTPTGVFGLPQVNAG